MSDSVSKSFCGYITLAGRTNAGKSALLNTLVNKRVSITSPAPQTTRSIIYGMLTESDRQAVFMDTPGAFNIQKVNLQNLMYKQMIQGLFDAQIVLLVSAANWQKDESLVTYFDFIAEHELPFIIAINKIDLLRNKNDVFPLTERISNLTKDKGIEANAIIPVSTIKNINIQLLRDSLLSMLPAAPYAYNKEIKTLGSKAFIACEFLREQMFRKLRQEVPFSLGVICDRMENINNKEKNTRHIDLTVLVTKEKYKPIILGKQGANLKEIATKARISMEEFFSQKVMLRVRIKTSGNWDKNADLMRQAVLGK